MTIKTQSLSEVTIHCSTYFETFSAYFKGSLLFRDSWKLLALPLVLFIALPLLTIFQHITLEEMLTSLNLVQVIQAIGLSIITSLTTILITLAFGTPVAYLLTQRHSRLHQFIDTVIDLPTVLPPSVAGVALLMAFGRMGTLGPLLNTIGISIPFTIIAVIMAQTFIAAPLYVKAAIIGFSSIDPELKLAAALDGANRWQVFLYVILPLTWAALLSGLMMTWARAIGEFGATIIFAGNYPGRTQTMPLAIYIGFEIDMKVALTLATIMIYFSFLTLFVVKRVLQQQMDAKFGFSTTCSD
jgi:molybdate transport system permease protein